ncbi:hypothetical protein DRA46_00078 [Burkholderia gladioli]|nr:hypothetical protein [Burkholderia gladioli]
MRRSTQGCVLPGPEDSESRRSRFRRLSVLLLAAAAGPVSSSSRARTSAGRRRVKGASAGWCGRERSGRHGPARLDAAKACATVAVLGRRADGDGRSVAAACRGGGTPRAASALSEARSGSGGKRGWRDVSSGCRSRGLGAWADDQRQQLAPGAAGGSGPPSTIQVAWRLASGRPRRGTPPATRCCSWRVAQREPGAACSWRAKSTGCWPTGGYRRHRGRARWGAAAGSVGSAPTTSRRRSGSPMKRPRTNAGPLLPIRQGK